MIISPSIAINGSNKQCNTSNRAESGCGRKSAPSSADTSSNTRTACDPPGRIADPSGAIDHLDFSKTQFYDGSPRSNPGFTHIVHNVPFKVMDHIGSPSNESIVTTKHLLVAPQQQCPVTTAASTSARPLQFFCIPHQH
ncbi:hypothetical protein [Porphyrobacter sp. TH134]|uniref:hypothetical protein n=1 Tax=Porphyrobacter sp. TH134 TaxID=2067450 RepID=UPI00117DAA66|nr:hypothetical protein [Porphyrobacter sp. TH134]